MTVNDNISLRDQILNASRNLVIEEGYQNLSMRKIAADIGISATSIYLHFENKDHLVHTLMEISISRLNNQLEEVASQTADPVRRLGDFARTYVDFALSNPSEYQIIYEVNSDQLSRYPKEKFRKARKGYELLTQTIEEGIEKGVMEEENPRMASYIFWAQLHGVISVVLTKRLDIRIDKDDFIKQAIDHVLEGFHVRTAVTEPG